MGHRTIFGYFATAMVIIGLSSNAGMGSSVRTSTACLIAADGSTVSTPVAATAENYAFGGVNLRHWNKSQITVSVEGASDRKHSVEDTRRLLENAVALWNKQVSPVVQVTVTDKANADITVAFVSWQSLPQRAVGRTSVTFGAFSGNLFHASILVQQGLSTDSCQQAVAHELGHALGIDGHSPFTEDMMFYRAHLPGNVTYRDANTLRRGYGVLPNSTGITPSTQSQAGTSVPVGTEADGDIPL